MENFTAYVGGAFALGGVIITKIFDLLGNRSKAKHDLDREA
jgi:hypothetical protein